MTLTKFMARSTWVAHAFGWEKLLKCHMKGKASKKLTNGQNIDYSEKRKWPKGFICPCTGVKYHNIQTCLLVYAADSGERLQDHWSSGFLSTQALREWLSFVHTDEPYNKLLIALSTLHLVHFRVSDVEHLKGAIFFYIIMVRYFGISDI